MNNEPAFLKQILAEPENATHRLVFADWLEEDGNPKGKAVRLFEQALELALDKRDYCHLLALCGIGTPEELAARSIVDHVSRLVKSPGIASVPHRLLKLCVEFGCRTLACYCGARENENRLETLTLLKCALHAGWLLAEYPERLYDLCLAIRRQIDAMVLLLAPQLQAGLGGSERNIDYSVLLSIRPCVRQLSSNSRFKIDPGETLLSNVHNASRHAAEVAHNVAVRLYDAENPHGSATYHRRNRQDATAAAALYELDRQRLITLSYVLFGGNVVPGGFRPEEDFSKLVLERADNLG
jgi:uncharacterized protein (TIGR02996 family)